MRENMLNDMYDVKIVRGKSGGMSDNVVALCKHRLVGG